MSCNVQAVLKLRPMVGWHCGGIQSRRRLHCIHYGLSPKGAAECRVAGVACSAAGDVDGDNVLLLAIRLACTCTP